MLSQLPSSLLHIQSDFRVEHPKVKKKYVPAIMMCIATITALTVATTRSLAADDRAGRESVPTLPPGFILEEFGGNWHEAIGVSFADDGTLFAWERAGRVYMFRNNQWYTPIDIREEVGAWRDHGLLGFALDPNFLVNGRVYLLYVVDRHHLLHFGTPQYNPLANEYLNATIGRITRFTLDVNNNFQTIVPNSRLVLLGESITTGIPILHESHGVGTLLFATDGTLLASCGDGASYIGTDTGGSAGGSYALQALADGIIAPKENVGAFRSQLVDCFNGKILRLDPNTGDGVSSNPFYDASAPRAPQSRVWALGLRNPCRMSLRPDTGSHIPSDGDPGAVYIGDVGMNNWEELSICTGLDAVSANGAQNFGWPIYEGFTLHAMYGIANTANLDAPNPLHNQGGCTQQFFRFRDLLIQDTLNPNPFFPNPCNASQPIPASVPTFVHRRPEIDYGHGGPARTGIFTNGSAAVINIGAPGSPVSGPQFSGSTSIGGAWYTPPKNATAAFPQHYHNLYFHCDFSAEWIKCLAFDENNEAISVESFGDGIGHVITLSMDPLTGDLYFPRWEKVHRIRYAPTGNQSPVAVATADVTYGVSPLTVQFIGSKSSDPNNDPLEYLWNFGDGQTSAQADPKHTFIAPAGVPTAFNVSLTVTDSGNLTAQTSLIVSVNNTPPVVSIVSPVQGSTYSLDGSTTYWLVPSIADAEHNVNEMTCRWQTILHHDAHTHQEPPDFNCFTTSVISPVGCDQSTYYYRITLVVTDAAGLSATSEVTVNPNCDGNIAPIAQNDTATVMQGQSVQIEVLANDSDADGTLVPAGIAIIQPPTNGSASVDSSTGLVLYSHNGSLNGDSFTYTANDNDGGTSNLASVTIDVQPLLAGDTNGDGIVNVSDLLAVINGWGDCPAPPAPCIADVAPHPGGDGVVNVSDLLLVINNWTS